MSWIISDVFPHELMVYASTYCSPEESSIDRLPLTVPCSLVNCSVGSG